MIRRNILLVAVWAVATTAVTLPFVLPTVSHAVGDAPKSEIATPKLTVGQCDYTVRWVTAKPASSTALTLDALPKLELTAINRGQQDATADFHLVMQGGSPSDMMSRVPIIRPTYWQQADKLIVRAGETKIISFTPTITPPTPSPAAGIAALARAIPASGQVILTVADNAIYTAPFTFKTVGADPAVTVITPGSPELPAERIRAVAAQQK